MIHSGNTLVTLRCQCHVTLINYNIRSVQKDKKKPVNEREKSHNFLTFCTLVTLANKCHVTLVNNNYLEMRFKMLILITWYLHVNVTKMLPDTYVQCEISSMRFNHNNYLEMRHLPWHFFLGMIHFCLWAGIHAKRGTRGSPLYTCRMYGYICIILHSLYKKHLIKTQELRWNVLTLNLLIVCIDSISKLFFNY